MCFVQQYSFRFFNTLHNCTPTFACENVQNIEISELKNPNRKISVKAAELHSPFGESTFYCSLKVILFQTFKLFDRFPGNELTNISAD